MKYQNNTIDSDIDLTSGFRDTPREKGIFPLSIGLEFGQTTPLSVSTVRSNAGQKQSALFPDGQSALMLVCARLRHVAATNWGARRYMNMDHLFKAEDNLLSDIIAG